MEENKETIEETKVEPPKKKKSGLFTIFACIMTGIIVFLAMNIGNMLDDIINPRHYNVGTGSSDNNKDLTIDLDVSQGAREGASYTVTPEGIVTVEERKAGNCSEGAEGCYLRPVYYVKGVKAGTAQVTVTVFDFSTKTEKRKAVYDITVDKDLKLSEKHTVTKNDNFGKNPGEDILETAKTGTVIEYTISKVSGTQEEVANYSYVKLSADKKLVWGKKNTGDEGSKQLTDVEYNDIIKLAFDKSFKDLGANLSDNTVTDGNSVYVTLYYADGTSFKTGGLNPTNEKFKSLTSKLDSFTQNSVSE